MIIKANLEFFKKCVSDCGRSAYLAIDCPGDVGLKEFKNEECFSENCKKCWLQALEREQKVQFIAASIKEFEGIEITEKFLEEIRRLNDEELQEKFEFADYLWDK